MSELAIVDADAPNLATMQRADLPAIWDGYRSELDRLTATARTLTVTDSSQKAEIAIASTTRKALKRLRCNVEDKRKELTEHHLRAQQTINAAAREIKAIIEPLEARLLEQEQFAERQEAARKAKLTVERFEAMAPFGIDLTCYKLGEMTTEAFDALYENTALAAEAKMEAARKAEEERAAKAKADAEERERMRLENERLKKEAEEREASARAERAEAERLRIEAETKARLEREALEAKARSEREAAEAEARKLREKAERERKVAEEKARKEREAIEAKAKAEREALEAKLRAEQDAAAAGAKVEREAREKLEAENRAREEKEEADRWEAEQERLRAERAPDKEKLVALKTAFSEIKFPALSTSPGKEARDEIFAAANSLLRLIQSKIDTL